MYLIQFYNIIEIGYCLLYTCNYNNRTLRNSKYVHSTINVQS